MDKANEDALKQLEEYRRQGCHMLIPVMQNITDVVAGFRLIVTATKIAAHPRDGDVYPHDSAQYDTEKDDWKVKTTGSERVRFHAQGFQRLAQDANIIWSRPDIIVDPTIEGRMTCSITGAIILPGGISKYSLPDISGSDIGIERESLIAKHSFNGKFDDKKQWIVDRDLLRLKKYQQKMIVTNVKNRVTERILGLKKTYTVAELEKPFVSVRVVWWPDMTDKFTRELFIKGQVAQMFITNIYGPSGEQEQPAITYGHIPAEKCSPSDDNVIDADTTPGNGNGNGTPYRLGKTKMMPVIEEDVPFALGSPPPSTAESLRMDFLNCDEPGQAGVLTSLITQKGQTGFVASWMKGFKAQPATLVSIGSNSRLKLYDHLVAMADGKEVAA
jgi:hypothetical protein